MKWRPYIDRATLTDFLTQLGAAFAKSGRLYLIGETTQVWEGWRDRSQQLEFAAGVAPASRAVFDAAVQAVRDQMNIDVWEESPGDVIPLPAGYETRARSAGKFSELWVCHFDPYSVAFRLIARGDEPDYHAVLAFLQHGWLAIDEMIALLTALLPQFTSETIQQDPAEFRRKFRGLLQMWRAESPRESEAIGQTI